MRFLALLLAVVFAAGCGDEDSSERPAADPEGAWTELLTAMQLEPAPALIDVVVRGKAPNLEVTLASKAQDELVFADGLYGARAYAFAGERWERVDTAEIRTQIAPLLGPGERASFRLPVREAQSYRVLVPVQGQAAWGDVR